MSIEPMPPVKTPAFLRISLLLICAAVVGVVGLVGWRMIEQGHQVNELLAQRAQLEHDAVYDRKAAATDRATAAANQKALLDYTASLAARQDALLAYLRAHGIHLPQRLVTVISPPRIVVNHPRAGRHVKRHRSSTGSGGSTTPAGPGKSGSAPGHHKHPRHGHRHR